MKKTPEEHKRENVRKLFNKILQSNTTFLTPKLITIHESFDKDETVIDYCFLERTGDSEQEIKIKASKGQGFIDCLFSGCLEYYVDKYHSVANIELEDVKLEPLIKNYKNTRGSDALINLCFKVKICNHGTFEFNTKSRSIINSSYTAVLETFQFYINCHRAFYKIKDILENAKSRNRGDIVQACLSDLSCLTEMNNYVK